MIGEDLDPLQQVLYQHASLAFVGLGPYRNHVEIREDQRDLLESDLQVAL